MLVALVLRQGMRLVAIGLGIGLLLGAAAARVVSAGPLGIAEPNPFVFGIAPVLFTAVGLGACAVPVLRATRIRAMDVLRFE